MRAPDSYGLLDKDLFAMANFIQSRKAEIKESIAKHIDPESASAISERWYHAFTFPGVDVILATIDD